MIPVEVTQTPWHYTTFWDWLDHWQTGLAGAGALLAALIAVGGSEWRARTGASLASEVRLYIDLMIKTQEMLIRMRPEFLHEDGKGRQRDLRDFAVLPPPTVYPAAVGGTLGLLRRPRAGAVVAFYATVERLNLPARVMSNQPDEKVRLENYATFVDRIEEACRASLLLLSGFPRDKRDAEFRAKIAKWDAAHAQFRAEYTAKWVGGHPPER